MKTERKLNRLSLVELAVHDLRRVLRSRNLKLSHFDALKLLVEQRQKATRSFSASAGLSILLLIWIFSKPLDPGSSLSISAFGSTVEINLLFAVLILASGIYGTMDGIGRYVILDQQIDAVARMISRYGNPTIISTMLDGGTNNTSIGQFRYPFFWTSDRRHRALVGLQLVIMTLILILAAAILFIGFLTVSFGLLFSGPITFVEGCVLVLAIALPLYSIYAFAVLFIPLKITRDQRYIRWIFLFGIHRRYLTFLPKHWSSKKESPL